MVIGCDDTARGMLKVRMLLLELVAEWLRRWTQDLGIWGLILAAMVRCKDLGQALNPHRLCLLSSNGYQVD